MKKRRAYNQYANGQLNQCTRYSNLAIVSESEVSTYFSSKDDCHILIQRMCNLVEIVESKRIAKPTIDLLPIPPLPPPILNEIDQKESVDSNPNID